MDWQWMLNVVCFQGQCLYVGLPCIGDCLTSALVINSQMCHDSFPTLCAICFSGCMQSSLPMSISALNSLLPATASMSCISFSGNNCSCKQSSFSASVRKVIFVVPLRFQCATPLPVGLADCPFPCGSKKKKESGFGVDCGGSSSSSCF